MTADSRLLDLWSQPPDHLLDPLVAFRDVYADPVTINGAAWPVADLVERARALHAAFTEHAVEVVDRVETPGKLVIAFRLFAAMPPFGAPLGLAVAAAGAWLVRAACRPSVVGSPA